MASVEGLDENRFLEPVPANLHCAICLNVMNQPMQCVRNEHSFCHACITKYVRQSPECPTCREHLTVETLRPARLVTQLVSQLIVRCDNSDLGCPATMKLESLRTHVRNCEFRPVRCSNEGCEMTVNSKDQVQHETSECRFRRATCPVCGEDVLYDRREFHCFVTRTEMNEVKRCLEETKDKVRKLKDVVTSLSNDMTRFIGTVTDDMATVKNELNIVRNNMVAVNIQVADVMSEVATMKSEVATMKTSAKRQVSPRQEVSWITQPRERCGSSPDSATSKFFQEKQRPVFPSSYLATSLKEDWNLREDIVVAGGVGLKSVESFSWLTKQWSHLPDMTSERWHSSAFVHQQRMFLYGGDMQTLSLSEHGAKWENFPGKLPPPRYCHASVVCEDCLFIFGGCLDYDNFYNDIYKVCLVPPYSSQLVCHFPEGRGLHGAQRFEQKVVIVGGITQAGESNCLDSVVVYDIANNCCQTLPPLPFAVRNMATVAWRDNIIVVGGEGKNGDVLNTVVSYNVTNGKSKMLPPMINKRCGCTAVVTGNILIVMGGWNKEEEDLNSVESFNFCTYSWEDLPRMNEKRQGATAIKKTPQET